MTTTLGLQRRTVLAALGAALPGASAWAASEHNFPSRPVRLVVPYSVGIGPDVVARAMAEQLSMRWGQPVLVDNKPGASGIVAFGDVRRTAPDGHTLYLGDTATLAVNPLLHANLLYDPAHDLVPLTLLFRATFMLLTGGSSRLRSVTDLLAAARQGPDRVTYASLGNGHASQLAVEVFARAAGLRMQHVPFKDAGALFTAVASGDVDFTAFSINSVAGLVASGRLRPLAVAAKQRLASQPDIPTLAEAGGPALEMHPWAALVMPAGAPAALQARLHQDLLAAMATPEVRGRAGLAGFEITPSTQQGLRERIAVDIALYLPLLEEGRITRF